MPQQKKIIGLREVRVGLFVIIAIVVLVFLILNASGDISFARKLRVKAKFANAEGLRPGAEVRLAGVRIGRVTDVNLLPPSDDPNSARVEAILALDQNVDGKSVTELVRTDSTAQLGSPSLLGSDRVINIVPGTPDGQPIPENYELPSTTSESIAQLTTSSNELVRQLNRLSVQLTDITQKINEGEGTLGRFVNDDAFYNNLNATVRDTQAAIRDIRSGQGSAAKLINDPALYNNLNAVSQSLQSIADDIRAGRGTAGRLLTDEALYNDARATVARFNRSVEEVNTIVADIRAGRGTAGRLLTDEALYNDARAAIARFNTAAERVDNLVAGVQRGEGTLGRLVTDEQLYNNVNQLSSESVKLIYDFRQNPKKYLTVRFSIF
ncbi:MAG: MlaD family protein [Pyrinomonadaceae bacterium]